MAAQTAAAAVTDADPLVKKKAWKYKSFQATSCWLGGRPFSQKPNVFFGSPNGVRCAVAYVTVSGVVAYNGKQAWGTSIAAAVSRSLRGKVRSLRESVGRDRLERGRLGGILRLREVRNAVQW
jgi:hypothetical protein